MNKLDLVKITMVKELKERIMMLLVMKMSKTLMITMLLVLKGLLMKMVKEMGLNSSLVLMPSLFCENKVLLQL